MRGIAGFCARGRPGVPCRQDRIASRGRGTTHRCTPAATVAALAACARAAEAAGLDSLWVADHVAVPPDHAEGWGGRYIEPLVTPSYLAAITGPIGLGSGVLVLPHRTPLSVAKGVASLQELCGGRLTLGVGVGAMQAECTMTGTSWARRGGDRERNSAVFV